MQLLTDRGRSLLINLKIYFELTITAKKEENQALIE